MAIFFNRWYMPLGTPQVDCDSCKISSWSIRNYMYSAIFAEKYPRKLLLKSFVGVTPRTNNSSFQRILNLNLNSPRIWFLTLFHIKRISYSLNDKINFSIRHSRHTLPPYFQYCGNCPIPTPEVISQWKMPSSYEIQFKWKARGVPSVTRLKWPWNSYNLYHIQFDETLYTYSNRLEMHNQASFHCRISKS